MNRVKKRVSDGTRFYRLSTYDLSYAIIYGIIA